MRPVHPVRILHISRNVANRRELQRLLQSTNWELTQVFSLEEAVLHFQQTAAEYSVVMSERVMPTPRWKTRFARTDRLWTLPMFIVTAPMGETRCWAEALSAGADDVIATPFERGELVWVVREAHLAWLRHIADRQGAREGLSVYRPGSTRKAS